MNSLKSKLLWLDNNRELAYTFIRIFLGIALFVRGIIMLANPSAITSISGGRDLYWFHSLIMIFHLFCGISLVLGFQTRTVALLQLPILFGAVFYIHAGEGFLNQSQSLELSILVLFLLGIYLLFGPGLYSLDNRFSNDKISK